MVKSSDIINRPVDEVTIDNKSGRGAVPNNQEVDYFGMRVKMKPSTFIKLASKLGKEPEDEMIDYIKKGGAIGSPFLIISTDTTGENASVINHEGRNRMLAVMKAEGDVPIEVHLFFNSNQVNRARHLTPELIGTLKQQLISQDNNLVRGPLWENSRVVKGVNTTVDVGPNEIKTQAAKFGNSVTKDGVPPTLSKKVKGASTNVLFNLGLVESVMVQFERGPAYDVLHIKEKGKNRVEVRGKKGYDSYGYDPKDKLHQTLDKLGKAANISDLMNGEPVVLNPKHPDGPKAIGTVQKEDAPRYTAAEWAIIEGGHSLEDITPQKKLKLFNFDKY